MENKIKIYLNKAGESWVADRFRDEWYQNSKFKTKFLRNSDIVWIISPWTWQKLDTSLLKTKKVVCTIHHLDIDKFNDKYNGLNQRQKNILREYINNVTNTIALKEYVQKEIPYIQKQLSRASNRVGSKIIKIKLNEVNSMLSKIHNAPTVKDKDVLTMLRYYELIKELKNMEIK